MLLRSAGLRVTQQQLKEFIAEAGNDNNGVCTRDEFLYLMSKKVNEEVFDTAVIDKMVKFESNNDKNKCLLNTINNVNKILAS